MSLSGKTPHRVICLVSKAISLTTFLSQVRVYSNNIGNFVEYILLFTLDQNFNNVSEVDNKSIQLYFRSETNKNFDIYLTLKWQVPLSNLKVG